MTITMAALQFERAGDVAQTVARAGRLLAGGGCILDLCQEGRHLPPADRHPAMGSGARRRTR